MRNASERRVADIRETGPDLEVVALPETERDVYGIETLSVISDRLPVSASSEP